MSALLRKDVDFSGLFRKLGHPLEEIRVRALQNIQSKLEHKLICDADIIQEKSLYVRLLEWFNIPDCSHKAEILALIARLAQHSAGSQILLDIGAVEFLSQLRCDIEPCHRPIVDQILESVMLLPDPDLQSHAPECIYHKPSDSAVWGNSLSSAAEASRSRLSQTSEGVRSRAVASMERLSQYLPEGPSYFAGARQPQTLAETPAVTQGPNPSATDFFMSVAGQENSGSLFRLSTFPWVALTYTDQHVISSTNNSLQTRDSGMLVEACEFLSDVVFQDFPAEIFLQRPEILKSLLSLVSLRSPAEEPVVIQACKSLTCYIRCLQTRIHYFQDPAVYMAKQDLSSSNPGLAMPSSNSSGSYVSPFSGQHPNLVEWGDRRHRGDCQGGDSSASSSSSVDGPEQLRPSVENDPDLDQEPRSPAHQLTLPQLCVAVLQRSLPVLRTGQDTLGVSLLELIREAVMVLSAVLDPGLWTDGSEIAREILDRLTDCLEVISELLDFHSQSWSTAETEMAGSVFTHRILYLGLAVTLAEFLLMIPLENVNRVVPEKLKSCLRTLVFDESLSILYPRCRVISLAITQKLGLSIPADFQRALEVCRSITKTCIFCLHCKEQGQKVEELAGLTEDSLLSLCYHLHLPFVSDCVQFVSTSCSKKTTSKAVVASCTSVLLKLMAYPLDNVRQVCYSEMLDVVQKSLQVSHTVAPKSKEHLKTKFIVNSSILFELVCHGFSDQSAKVRACATDLLHHLLKSQLLMSEALWQEFILALHRSLPALQSYTDQNTLLGRSLWSMLDPTTTTHNLSLVEKLRGCLRLLYLSDKKLRLEAAKHVLWFMNGEQDGDRKLPASKDLDLGLISGCMVVTEIQIVNEDWGRSVFTEAGMKQVYDIFVADPVDASVKRSAGDQLAIMMRDPRLHIGFKERGGVEIVCAIVQKAVVMKDKDSTDKEEVGPYLSACLSILKSLTQHDFSLRHTLARESSLYLTLMRVSLLYQDKPEIKAEVSCILAFMVFDEVAKLDIGPGQADAPGTLFSLPAQVIQRYRLPFKPGCHDLSSPHALTVPDASCDIMKTAGAKDMIKVAWNIAWHGGLEPLLDSFQNEQYSKTVRDFSKFLAITPMERTVLEASALHWNLRRCVDAVRNAASHGSVITWLDQIMLFASALRVPAVTDFFTATDWYTALDKFLTVKPTSTSDQSLLKQVLQMMRSVLGCLRSLPPVAGPALVWLLERLYKPDGPVMSLLNQPAAAAGSGGEHGITIRRSLNKELLAYVSKLNTSLPYQLCQRAKLGQVRADLVRQLQLVLGATDAPHFYNLASLVGALICLMHVMARPGWSAESSGQDGTALCDQLLNSLLEVIWSFHVGRGGTSQSLMGRGVTKAAAVCLLHVSYEMSKLSDDDQDWVKRWLYVGQNQSPDLEQGLNWLMTLWTYRDPQVRSAGLGIAVSLTSVESGRSLMLTHCKKLTGGIWGAALSRLLNPHECCMVQHQAALLLVNLTSQTLPSGDIETRPAAWQGPVITDEQYQVVLVGVKALETLLDQTNFYLSVADMVASLYTRALVQPVLVTLETSKLVDTLVNSTSLSATDTGSWDNSGQTLLTTLSTGSASLASVNQPDNQATTQTKDVPADSVNKKMSASNSETPRGLPGEWREVTTFQHTGARTVAENQMVATPGLVSAIVKLLANLANLTPQSCLPNLRRLELVQSLLRLVSPGTIQSLCAEMTTGHLSSASALTLRDLLLMYESVAQLLIACVTMDTTCRLDILGSHDGLKSLAALLLLQWTDVDDISTACISLSTSILQLFCSLLQTQGAVALKTLTQILGQLWSPLIDCLSSMLEDKSPSRRSLHLTSLDFLALLFNEECRSLVKNPDRVSDVATVSELLDASLSDDSAEDPNKEQTTARHLCKNLVSLFDSVLTPSKEDKTGRASSRRMKVFSALKSLLAVSLSAKQCALDAGLVESIIEYLKQAHAQLNLETLGLLKQGPKKEEPLLQELVTMFDLMRNLLCGSTEAKVACYHSGLTLVLLRLWAWCMQEPALLSSCLNLVSAYTANCSSAASSMAMTTTSLTALKPGGQGSLLNFILKLTQRELDRDECSPLLKLLFAVLGNLALNSDCKNVIGKLPFLHQFSGIDPRKRRGKSKVAIEVLWCELLLALSFSTDGQQIVLKIPDSLTVLMDLAEAGAPRSQYCSTLIIRNLCCHAPNKPKLLAAEKLIPVLLGQIKNRVDKNIQLVAASALWALLHNNHKAKVQVKSAHVIPVLVDTLHSLEEAGSRSQVAVSTCDNVKAIIDALQE